MNGSLTFTYYLALLSLGALWSASFLFIKVGVAEMPPLVLVELRVVFGSMLLLALLTLLGRPPRGWRAYWRGCLGMGIMNAVLPWALLFWGEQHITSGLAAILNATAPLWTALLDHFWPGGERLTLRRLGGVLIGFLGVVVLIGPDSARMGSTWLLAALAALGTPLCYAVAALYARGAFRGAPVPVPAVGQNVAAALLLAPALLALPPVERLSPAAIGSVAGLAIGSTALAFLLFFFLVDRFGPVRAMMVTYLLPTGGLLWGALLLGERPGPGTFGGLLLILVSIGLVAGLPSRRAGGRRGGDAQAMLGKEGT